MRRLLPDPGPTTVSAQLETYRPWEEAREDRPLVAMNFVATVDGRATIEGRSGPIGSDTDTTMLAGLRTRFDAVMIGAGTMRVEQYGRLVSKQETREQRQRAGLPPEPLMVLVSGRLDLPWDAPLFSEGGEVLIFTAADTEPPDTAASVEVVRHEGAVNFREAMHLRRIDVALRRLHNAALGRVESLHRGFDFCKARGLRVGV
ncbi:MAG: dihydrofolate reductase family protein, partial [Solirubrobacterales bacterium]